MSSGEKLAPTILLSKHRPSIDSTYFYNTTAVPPPLYYMRALPLHKLDPLSEGMHVVQQGSS